MTLARTYPRTIMEKQDIALLEFQERPPFYYNAYYAGWNVSDDTTTVKAAKPFTNLHQPMRDLKRYNRSTLNLSITSFTVQEQGYPSYQFAEKSHWIVPRWTLGSTWYGSSGSPLFDNNNLIIGALTSGKSACSDNKPNGQWDVFSILYKGWDINNDFETVKSRLNPNNRNIQQQPGFDPHAQNPLQRIGNVNYTSENQLIKTEYAAPNSGNLFGTNNLQTAEYAEEFHLEKDALLHGAYLFLPPLTNTIADVKIKIYTGNNAPETLLDEKTFLPQYLNYNGSFYLANKNMATKTENFVPFDGLQVGKKFWIAYAIGSNTSNFAVCNTQFDSPETPNTAWIKDAQGNWTPAGQYAPQPTKTSLAIQALLTNKEGVAITPIAQNRWEIVYQRAENRLILPDESEGMISIYSANGQLQQQIPVVRGQKSVVIRPSAKGSIGIVRWTNEKSTLIGKIIY
jgi:hypothetical protein